jgi:hypothetical protein
LFGDFSEAYFSSLVYSTKLDKHASLKSLPKKKLSSEDSETLSREDVYYWLCRESDPKAGTPVSKVVIDSKPVTFSCKHAGCVLNFTQKAQFTEIDRRDKVFCLRSMKPDQT